MNELFKGSSMTSSGTLYNIKDMFHHNSAKRDVMQNVQHVWDLIMVIYGTLFQFVLKTKTDRCRHTLAFTKY